MMEPVLPLERAQRGESIWRISDPIQSPHTTATYTEGYSDTTQRNYVFGSSGPAQFFGDQEMTFTVPSFPADYLYGVATLEPYFKCCENGLLEGLLSRNYGSTPQAIGNLQTAANHKPGSHDASTLQGGFPYPVDGPFSAGNGFDRLPVGQDSTRTLYPKRHIVPNSGFSNASWYGLNPGQPLTGNGSYVVPQAPGKESANNGPKPEDWNPKSLDVTQLQIPQNLRELNVPKHNVVPQKNPKVGHQRASNRAHPRKDSRCNVLQPKHNQGLQCKPFRTRRSFTSAEKKQIKWCREVGACSSCRAKKGKVCHGCIRRRTMS